MADELDNAPAVSGEIRISHSGFLSSTVYAWPIAEAGEDTPAIDVRVRVRDDGEIFLSIDENWDDSFVD